MAESEEEQYLRHKVEHLERQREQGTKTQHMLVGMAIGLSIYALSGFTGMGGFIGVLVAAAYMIAKKSFF